jgi:hypothetical protein
LPRTRRADADIAARLEGHPITGLARLLIDPHPWTIYQICHVEPVAWEFLPPVLRVWPYKTPRPTLNLENPTEALALLTTLKLMGAFT